MNIQKRREAVTKYNVALAIDCSIPRNAINFIKCWRGNRRNPSVKKVIFVKIAGIFLTPQKFTNVKKHALNVENLWIFVKIATNANSVEKIMIAKNI